MRELSVSLEQVLDCLGTISLGIQQSQSLDSLLNTTVQEVRKLLQTDRVIIYRVQAEGSGIAVAESVDSHWMPMLGQSIPDIDSQASFAASDNPNTYSTLANICTDEPHNCNVEFLTQFQFQGSLVVPILENIWELESLYHNSTFSIPSWLNGETADAGVRTVTQGKLHNQLWGWLIVEHGCEPQLWQSLEVKLLEHIAVQISIAIEHSRVTDIMPCQQAEQQRDRETAQQHCLLQEIAQQNQSLEAQVQESTTELRRTNERLRQEITERQRLEARNTLLATAVEYAGDAIEITNINCRFEYVNPAFERITGYSQGEVIGKTPNSPLWSSEYNKEFYQKIEDTVVSGQVWRGNLIATCKNGSLCYQEATLAPVRDSTGAISHYVAIKRDISDRKQIEEELRKSEERWQLVIKGNNEGIWDLNLQTNQVFRSARYKEIMGYEDHELGDDNIDWMSRIHPDDFERVMQVNQDYLDQKIPCYAVEYRLRCKNGGYKWVMGRAQAVWDEAGYPVRMVGSTTDITDRKQAEEALCQSEQQLRQIFEEAPIGIALAEFETHRFIRANPIWCQLLGYSVSELMSLTFDEISHPNDLAEDLHYMKQIEQGQLNSFCLEKRYYRKNGELMWVSLTVTALQNSEDKPCYSLAMIEDITERKQLQINLSKSEERFRTSIDNMLDCFVIYRSIRDASNQIVDFSFEYANAAAWTSLNVTKEELVGQYLCELLPAHREIGLFDEYCQVVETGQSLVKESLVYEDTLYGQRLSGAYDIRAVKLGDGFACAWRDITARKQTEDQIKTSLLEKETLLKEIHHRVKNNLQVISSLLRLQSRKIRDTRGLELFQESQNRIKAMALIHEKLYCSANLAQIDFQDYIQSLAQELLRSYEGQRRGVNCTINIEPIPLPIDTAIPCGLIINELVSNALKYAFPERVAGKIEIRLQSLGTSAIAPPEKELLLLTISDNGVGFPEGLDFRNTHSLGLQLVCRLTNQLDGRLELHRNPNTEFQITFTNPNYK